MDVQTKHLLKFALIALALTVFAACVGPIH